MASTSERKTALSDSQLITPTVTSKSNFVSIDLSNSSLSELPHNIGSLSSVQILKANCNKLMALPTSVGQLKSLKELHLSGNMLSCLPFSLADLQILEIIDLSFNQFIKPPSCFEIGCGQVSFLNLSHNLLEDWIWIPLCVNTLKKLNLSFNKLKFNPAWLWTDVCLSLEDLNLSYNNFQNPALGVDPIMIWRTGVTQRLESLNLAACSLSPDTLYFIYNLKFLKKLDLGNEYDCSKKLRYSTTRSCYHKSHNVIWEFPLQSFSFRLTLSELIIPHLGLSYLPDNVECLEALQLLDCKNNQLQWLPVSFSRLSKLRIAVFSSNILFNLPVDFGELQSLEELWLDNNQICELPLSFSSLKQLCWLDLYGNYLELFPPTVLDLTDNLCGLDLAFNMTDFQIEMKEEQYKGLQSALRSHSQLKGAERNLTSRTLPPVLRHCLPHHHSEIFDDINDKYEISEDNQELHPLCEEVKEELWDTEGNHDDFFDPTTIPHVQKLSPLYSLYIIESICDTNAFCPCDIHPYPVRRAHRNICVHDADQFEDD